MELKTLLKDAALLRHQAYIDGQWCKADSGASFDVFDPATGASLGSVPLMGEAETTRAIEAANAAWPAWRVRTAKERAAVMRRWYDLMIEHADDLALILTAEQGKPLAEAKGEIAYGASFIEWFAEEGKRVAGDTL
ncbi:aldehyde dehydrogenase family protein, partial [Paraburkholderia sp. BR14261]